MHRLQSQYAHRLTVATVYIREAHAADEWRLQGTVMVDQPKTTAERVAVARRFRRATDWRIPIWVDPPDAPSGPDPFETAFAPWPLRFYLVRPDRTLAYIAAPVDETYDLVELDRQIEDVCAHEEK